MFDRFLLDATVYSDVIRRSPDTALAAWLDERLERCHICALTVMHMTTGIASLRARGGPERLARAEWYWTRDRAFLDLFTGRFIPLTSGIFGRAGEILGQARHRIGDIEESDCLLAAAAESRDLAVATRNARHFAATGVRFFDTSTLSRNRVYGNDQKEPTILKVILGGELDKPHEDTLERTAFS